jgi:hypothetical protein
VDFYAAPQGLTEMACRVAGEEDGDFGPGDYVEFYGHGCDYFEPVTATATGCQEYRKDLFTKYNVYWLVADETAGKRATPATVTPAGGVTPAYFWDRLHFEEDVFDIGESQPNMNEGFDEDDWLWREYTGPMTSANLLTHFDVRDLRTEGPDARFKIQIRPAPSFSNGPFHSVVFLNTPDGGHKILDEEYEQTSPDQGPIVFEKTVPFSLMETGSNGLYFQETGGQGTTEDSVYVDFFEFEYPRRYRAYHDYLRFSNPPDVTGTVQYEITGFTTDDLVLYDLSGGRRLTGFETRAEGGTYTLRFTDTVATGQRWYVAASAAAADAAPVDLYLDAGSALRDYDENVDLLVVVYDGYYDNVQPLVDWRRAQGHRVLVARATDVYDEYACGLFDPGAIRQFVKDIYTRAVQREGGELPDSLFLVGDAWRDFRDANKKYTTYKLYRDFGMNQCPTYYVYTGPSGRTASDNFLVAMDNTSYADLAVGRWAAPFDENVDALVDKTLAYERTAPNGPWNMRAVLSADNWDKVPDGGTGAFTYDNERVEAYYFPRGFEARKENIEWLNRRFPYVNQGDKGFDYMSRTDRKKYVAEFMKPNYKKGFDALILHYAGHGGPQAWAHENLMAHHKDIPIVDDIYDLENGPRYPIIIQCSCSTAYFDDERQPSESDPPDYGESISEYGTQAPGECAVAMMGSTRLGQENTQARFLEEFYAYIFPDRAPRDEAVAVGEAHFAAKINANDGLIRDCFVLLGDPALAVAAPRPGIELYPDKTSVRRGETLAVAGTVPGNFTGKATVTVFDRPFYFYSRDNSENYYRDRLVAETEVEVVNGQFDATVVVPTTPATPTAPALFSAAGAAGGAVGGGDADTASAASGTMNAAGTDAPGAGAATTADGSGVAAVGEEGLLYVKAVAYGSTFRDTYVCAETVTVGVAGDAASEDHAGPDVDVYLGDRTFRDGDPVGPTPDLIVDVRDESGVLIARNTETIGQSEELFIPLTAQVDSQAALDLTFYYQPALNDYRAGNVEKKLALAEGSHHITVVAYDSFGNRAEKTVHCVVSGGLGLVNVMNCPNPFPKDTYFTFQATTDIDSLVIKVYTATGRLIQKIEAGGLTAGYHQIHWDGRDRAGDAIANGVYFYTIVARAGDQKTIVREKLVKLR